MYLVVATSGRAIAQSLKASGHAVAVVDGYADTDTTTAAAICKRVARSKFGLDTKAVLQAIQNLRNRYRFDGLFYTTAVETHPDLLDAIPVSKVLGNSSSVLRRCKNPQTFFQTLDRCAIAHPQTSFTPIGDTAGDCLIKHMHSVGGLGIRDQPQQLNPGQLKTEPGIYLQSKIDGINFSLTFLTNRKQIQVLGFNTLWSEALGPHLPYAYTGAVNRVELTARQRHTAIRYATTLAREFNLTGLNSVDYILHRDRVYVLEINPRIPATYELYETRHGDLLKLHIAACTQGTLDSTYGEPRLRAHAILYAPDAITIPTDLVWPLWTADRPPAGSMINKHTPVCSVFAGGKNVAQVREMIHTRKHTIIAKLTRTKRHNKPIQEQQHAEH